MWTILESKLSKKQLKKCPRYILKEYEAWKITVEHSGPQVLRSLPGYRDHALKGEWKGARSSYLNIQWRVIYGIDKSKVTIFIIEVNAHDYG